MLQMIALAGEGKGDMGYCTNSQEICSGNALDAGPVARLLLKLIHQHLPDWNADCLNLHDPASHFTYLSNSWLSTQTKANRRQVFVGKQVYKGFEEHFRRAKALAEYALDEAHPHELAAYFHDTDGTRSELADMPDRQEKLMQAIKGGFRAAEFAERGIALVPKPTSEAWFICATKPNPYQHCGQLADELSGNDRSPERAPKTILGQYLQNPDYTRHDLNELVEQIDVSRIDMPCFNALCEQVKTTITAVCGTVKEQ